MKRLQKIVTRKVLIVLIGLITAIVVVGQPIMIEQFKVCSRLMEQTDDQSEVNDETVSTLEAVSPAHQIQDISTAYYILEEVILDEEVIYEKTSEITERACTNFIRVLFNFIIAPNAP